MRVASSLYTAVELNDLAAIRQFIEEKTIEFGADEGAAGELVMAVNEAVCNIILHGYQGQPGNVQIEIERMNDQITIRLNDQASSFDPTERPVPDISIPLDQREYGGMGVHMMREFTDELHYRLTTAGENELTMVKRLTK